jgi:LPXTG-motif cell wall-anchored protein
MKDTAVSPNRIHPVDSPATSHIQRFARRCVAGVFAAGLTMGSLVGGATAAQAAGAACTGGYPPTSCTAVISVPAGTTLTGKGTGFRKNSFVKFVLRRPSGSTVTYGSSKANTAGLVTRAFTIPRSYPSGTYTLYLYGVNPNSTARRLQATVIVHAVSSARPRAIPGTGSSTGGGGATTGGSTTGGTGGVITPTGTGTVAGTGTTTTGASGGQLANTGATVVGPIAAVGGLLFVGGIALLAVRRRRGTQTS